MTMTANGLAKLLEEAGELVQISAKKLAYFHTDEHPDGAGSMKLRLEDEIADVRAASKFVIQNFGLDETRIQARADKKIASYQLWHDHKGYDALSFEAVGRFLTERNSALEKAAHIAKNFGPSRPLVSNNPSLIERGRWEGEQAASENIAEAILTLLGQR